MKSEFGKLRHEVAEENGLEFVHAEVIGTGKCDDCAFLLISRAVLRIEDCSTVSREVGDLLDAEDFIPSAYFLEVSSPGLERELYSLQDFERFAGNLAKVKTRRRSTGKKIFAGELSKSKAKKLFLTIKRAGKFSFPYNAVAKANLEFDLEAELKGRSAEA